MRTKTTLMWKSSRSSPDGRCYLHTSVLVQHCATVLPRYFCTAALVYRCTVALLHNSISRMFCGFSSSILLFITFCLWLCTDDTHPETLSTLAQLPANSFSCGPSPLSKPNRFRNFGRQQLLQFDLLTSANGFAEKKNDRKSRHLGRQIYQKSPGESLHSAHTKHGVRVLGRIPKPQTHGNYKVCHGNPLFVGTHTHNSNIAAVRTEL